MEGLPGTVYCAGAYRPAADAAVSVFDHGLLYGDGVFEGIRAYNGRVFKLHRHIERLFDSAKAIRLDVPLPPAELSEIVLETCRRNEVTDGYIRVVVTRGAGGLGIDPRSCARPDLIVIARAVPSMYQRKPWEGITLVTSALRRSPPDVLSPAIKSLNYLSNVLARIEANDRGADEALFLDREGFVAEATADNIFIVLDDKLVTPPATSTLKGITRETVLELAAELHIKAEERPFTIVDVWTAHEAFMCGTMAEIVPIASVDGRVIGTGSAGSPGGVTSRLLTSYDRLVRSTGAPIHRVVPVFETAR